MRAGTREDKNAGTCEGTNASFSLLLSRGILDVHTVMAGAGGSEQEAQGKTVLYSSREAPPAPLCGQNFSKYLLDSGEKILNWKGCLGVGIGCPGNMGVFKRCVCDT